MSAKTTTATRRMGCVGRLLLILGGAVAASVLIELSVRIGTHSLGVWGSKESGDYFVTDPFIGRLPRAGVSLRHPNGFTITIGENGTRSNGAAAGTSPGPVTLAVGDSFAFGDGVDDQDTWPAVLEQLTGQRVVNAAVPGFGLDQAVLRAERLAAVYAPMRIIVSFIPHDVLRCEMAYWSGHAKPYFDVADTGLHFHPAPVPAPRSYAGVKTLLSKSVTLDLLFAPWLHWEGPPEQVVHRRGVEVACRLMDRLAAFSRAHSVQILILAQPQAPTATPDELARKDTVLACARAAQLEALDLFPVIEAMPLEQRAQLFPRHMSREGNQLVAAKVAEFLAAQAG